MSEVVLAACTDDQGLLASDLRSGALVATYDESTPQPNAFGIVGGSSGHLFAAQAKKAIWHVWGWGERKPCYRATFPEKMTAMTFTADAMFCFGGSSTGSIWVWQTSTGTLFRSWIAHFREVVQLLVSQDGAFLVSASADANVHIYNIADIFAEQLPKPFHSWAGHSLAVTSVALLPGSGLQQTVVSASLDRSVRIWDVGTGRPITSRSLAAPVHSVCAGPNSAEILCACGNGELHAFSPSAGPSEGSGPYSGHAGSVISCAMSIDGTQAASCSAVDRVRIWEVRTRQCMSHLHSSRNVQISGVQIVQRAAHAPGVPAFQALQRVLTPPEEAPQVALCMTGRAAALRQALQRRADSREFIDKLLWSTGGSTEGADDLRERLAEAQALQRRWAVAAGDLYQILASSGLDGATRPSPAPPPPAEPARPGAELATECAPAPQLAGAALMPAVHAPSTSEAAAVANGTAASSTGAIASSAEPERMTKRAKKKRRMR